MAAITINHAHGNCLRLHSAVKRLWNITGLVPDTPHQPSPYGLSHSDLSQSKCCWFGAGSASMTLKLVSRDYGTNICVYCMRVCVCCVLWVWVWWRCELSTCKLVLTAHNKKSNVSPLVSCTHTQGHGIACHTPAEPPTRNPLLTVNAFTTENHGSATVLFPVRTCAHQNTEMSGAISTDYENACPVVLGLTVKFWHYPTCSPIWFCGNGRFRLRPLSTLFTSKHICFFVIFVCFFFLIAFFTVV